MRAPSIAAAPSGARKRISTAWVVLIVLLLFSIAAPLNMGKVSPILPVLMDAFNLTVSRAGLLMSVYAITGLILALPAGVIFQKLGYRVTGLIAGGSIVIGAIVERLGWTIAIVCAAAFGVLAIGTGALARVR